MARRKGGQKAALSPDNLKMLEGLLQEMREQSPEQRPKKLPRDWIASQLCVSRLTVRNWIWRARSPKHRNPEELDHFLELFDEFCVLIAEEPVGALYRAATTPSQGQVSALKWLLPKIDPEMWGDSPPVREASGSTGVSGVPQEVMDDLTEKELLQLEQYQQEIAERMEATARLINGAKARVAQRVAMQH